VGRARETKRVATSVHSRKNGKIGGLARSPVGPQGRGAIKRDANTKKQARKRVTEAMAGNPLDLLQ